MSRSQLHSTSARTSARSLEQLQLLDVCKWSLGLKKGGDRQQRLPTGLPAPIWIGVILNNTPFRQPLTFPTNYHSTPQTQVKSREHEHTWKKAKHFNLASFINRLSTVYILCHLPVGQSEWWATSSLGRACLVHWIETQVPINKH